MPDWVRVETARRLAVATAAYESIQHTAEMLGVPQAEYVDRFVMAAFPPLTWTSLIARGLQQPA